MKHDVLDSTLSWDITAWILFSFSYGCGRMNMANVVGEKHK